MLKRTPGRIYTPFQLSLLQRQESDTINIQLLGAPACYVFWNRQPELLIEPECILRKLLPSEGFREVTNCRPYSAKRLAEFALQVSLHTLRFAQTASGISLYAIFGNHHFSWRKGVRA